MTEAKKIAEEEKIPLPDLAYLFSQEKLKNNRKNYPQFERELSPEDGEAGGRIY